MSHIKVFDPFSTEKSGSNGRPALPSFRKVLKPSKELDEKTKLSATPLDKPGTSDKSSSSALESRGKYSSVKFDDEITEPIPASSKPHATNHKVAQLHKKPVFKQILKQPTNTKTPSFSKADVKSILDSDFEGDDESLDIDKTKVIEVPGFVPTLLPHQSYGVNFLASRENARKYAKGGLLADAMGLGKTAQSIALMLYRPPSESDEFKTTLVVGPLAVLNQWKEEVEFMAPSLRVMTHHGQQRTTNATVFKDFNVVITSYDVVKNEFLHSSARPLFNTTWFRIIADEAHIFRNADTQCAKGMFALKSNERRWALTGTPIHNKVEDINTLLQFVGIDSFTNDVVSLKRLLKTVMLRRSQRVLRKVLPPIKMHKVGVELNNIEIQNYKESLANLTKMRMACDGLKKTHFLDLQKTNSWDDKEKEDDLQPSSGKDDLADLLGSMSLSDAPKGSPKYPGHANSKIQELRKILCEDRQRQTVIFSAFTTMLNAIKPMLDHEGISYDMYDGSLTALKRSEMIRKFKHPTNNFTVMLCSLHSAAVGINLANASQVVMIEPWWNPQILDQAVKRVHRLGQTRVVKCVELYAKGVLDERILVIQEKKRKLAKDIIDGVDPELSSEDHAYLMKENSELFSGDNERDLGKAASLGTPEVSKNLKNAQNDVRKEAVHNTPQRPLKEKADYDSKSKQVKQHTKENLNRKLEGSNDDLTESLLKGLSIRDKSDQNI